MLSERVRKHAIPPAQRTSNLKGPGEPRGRRGERKLRFIPFVPGLVFFFHSIPTL